jgi:signal transduction histidine kinase
VANLQWTQVEGTVSFAAVAGDRLQLELAGDKLNPLRVEVFNWSGRSTARLKNSQVRVTGVLERVSALKGGVTGGLLRVPEVRFVSVDAPSAANMADFTATLISEIEPSNPRMTWGKQIKVRGRVVRDESGKVLLRGNDTFQGYLSPDGTNWIPIGKPVEVAMSNSALVGISVASQNPSDMVTATFKHVKWPGTNWLTADIDNSGNPGRYRFDDSTCTVRGSGNYLRRSVDRCFFVYQALTGEGEIEARFEGFGTANQMAQAGLMIRESLDRGSVCAAVLATTAAGVRLQYRTTANETADIFVSPHDYSWLKVVRRKNFVQLQAGETPDVEPEQEVDVIGTLVWENGVPALTDVACSAVSPESLRASVVSPRELRSVSIEKFVAESQRPNQPYLRGHLDVFDLVGVVTFSDRVFGTPVLFIQDGFTGIQLQWPDTNVTASLRVGQSVRVSGRSLAGQFPVTLIPDTVTVMAWGPMPEAQPYSAGRSASRSRHGQWVEVRGVVRAVRWNGTLDIMGEEGLLATWVGHTSSDGMNRFVNARVRARGVLLLNPDPAVLVPSAEHLEILESSPPDPFSTPTFSVAALADLTVRPEELRQMKVSGVVTCLREGGLFLEDASGGAYAQTIEETSVRVGDQVEIVGFPSGRSSVILSEARVRKTGVGKLPSPAQISAEERNGKRYADRLVRVEGVVLEQRNVHGGQELSLQAGPRVLEVASGLADDRTGRWPDIPAGSRVAVTGVCQILPGDRELEMREENAARSITPIKIWLRTPSDVVLLQRPPWWTWKHTASVGALFAGALLGALVWVRTLRQRVAQRTRELQTTMSRLEKEIHTSAVLAERDRLAGEIHDSVEQGLTAIMLQLDAAAKQVEYPQEVRRCLKIARSMAGFSRAEVEHAVWDLQSPLLANADLRAALSHVASEISSGSALQVTVETIGQTCQFPSSVNHHLLRIGQEAITNAVKHAKARTVRVTLDYSDSEFRLSVEDDGVGFDPETVLQGSRSGHFGLHGIRARARKIQAAATISSRPGEGATIAVRMTSPAESAIGQNENP